MSTSTAPSLATATAEFAEATAAWNRAITCYWRLSAEEKAAAAERLWLATRDLNAAISEPVGAAS